MSIAPAKEGDERDAKLLRKKWEGLGPGFLFVKSVANKAHLNCKWRSFAELLVFSCVCVNSFYCDQQDFSDICPLLNKWVVFQSKRSEKHLAFDRHIPPLPPSFFLKIIVNHDIGPFSISEQGDWCTGWLGASRWQALESSGKNPNISSK